jgi:hypothetical protein
VADGRAGESHRGLFAAAYDTHKEGDIHKGGQTNFMTPEMEKPPGREGFLVGVDIRWDGITLLI